MTGPEHYCEAEMHALAAVESPAGDDGWMTDRVQYHLAMAQVHATLAVAAATACNPSGTGEVTVSGGEEWAAWRDVCGVKLNPAVSA